MKLNDNQKQFLKIWGVIWVIVTPLIFFTFMNADLKTVINIGTREDGSTIWDTGDPRPAGISAVMEWSGLLIFLTLYILLMLSNDKKEGAKI
jgi:hypothetical protein